MSVKRELLSIGFDKNGCFDFGVNMGITELDYRQMTEFRAMVTVAIGSMEEIWRRSNMERFPAAQCESPPQGQRE